jgi:DNA-binding NtrC family response regulator
MIGTSTAIEAFRARLAQVAEAGTTVLLRGESGVGKGLAARRLHAWSPRAQGPLVEASLAALAPTLIEAELFGHVPGAFTGAVRARTGRFRQAHTGTLVLDDVDTLPNEVQVKLLRVLQERTVEPVGAESGESVDVRVVATTQADLRAAVEAGRFRRDLYYRLAVVELEVPPLRARTEDLGAIAAEIIAALAEARSLPRRSLAPSALERLAAHSWPGNVRELENALERALVLCEERARAGAPLEAQDFAFLGEDLAGVPEEVATRALAAGLTLADVERAMLERAMREQRGNVAAAARALGLTRRAAEYRLARLGEAHETSEPSEGES